MVPCLKTGHRKQCTQSINHLLHAKNAGAYLQLCFSSYLRNEAKGAHFFEISAKLSQNKAVKVAKNIKI